MSAADSEWAERARENLRMCALAYANGIYAPTRYPDAVAGALPGGLPQETEAARALSTATDVMVTLD